MSSAWPPPVAIAKSDKEKWLLELQKLEINETALFIFVSKTSTLFTAVVLQLRKLERVATFKAGGG
jgi:hypothetical protein